MKKIIIFGLLVFIGLFSHTSKKQLEKEKDIPIKYNSNEKQLLINSNNHLSNKRDEPIKTYIDSSKKQHPVKHFSRHRKGKIIYIKNYPKTPTIAFE